jgi:hypothetical protein
VKEDLSLRLTREWLVFIWAVEDLAAPGVRTHTDEITLQAEASDMLQLKYCTDAMFLNTDRGSWKEQLHLMCHRQHQQGWQLIAIFPENAARAERPGPVVTKLSVAVTLLFQRSQREPRDRQGHSPIAQETPGAKRKGRHRRACFREGGEGEGRHELGTADLSHVLISAAPPVRSRDCGISDVDGIAVVVRPISGAMVEAAIGGQRFTYQAK